MAEQISFLEYIADGTVVGRHENIAVHPAFAGKGDPPFRLPGKAGDAT